MGLGWGRLAAVAAVLMAAPLCDAWAQAPADACALVSRDEFQALTGKTEYTDPTGMPWSGGTVCGFGNGQIILLTEADSTPVMDRFLTSAEKDLVSPRTPVRGSAKAPSRSCSIPRTSIRIMAPSWFSAQVLPRWPSPSTRRMVKRQGRRCRKQWRSRRRLRRSCHRRPGDGAIRGASRRWQSKWRDIPGWGGVSPAFRRAAYRRRQRTRSRPGTRRALHLGTWLGDAVHPVRIHATHCACKGDSEMVVSARLFER